MSQPQRTKQKCEAVNRENLPCKHYTVKGRFCHQHLKQGLNLRIKPSRIREAGLGVFTTQPVDPETVVATWNGKVLKSNEQLSGPYLLQYNRVGKSRKYIDAPNTTDGEGRFIQHCPKGAKRCQANVQAVFNPEKGPSHVEFMALKPIKKGKEIYTDYGELFTDDQKERLRVAMAKKDIDKVMRHNRLHRDRQITPLEYKPIVGKTLEQQIKSLKEFELKRKEKAATFNARKERVLHFRKRRDAMIEKKVEAFSTYKKEIAKYKDDPDKLDEIKKDFVAYVAKLDTLIEHLGKQLDKAREE